MMELLAGTACRLFIVCIFPAGKFAEKTVCRSVFLTIWHYILNADSTKTCVPFLAILPAGLTGPIVQSHYTRYKKAI